MVMFHSIIPRCQQNLKIILPKHSGVVHKGRPHGGGVTGRNFSYKF